MRQIKLSTRLNGIYNELLQNQELWDFCCDHGYLGLAAYQSGQFKAIHFVDQAPHLIEKIKKQYQFHKGLFFWPHSGEDLPLGTQVSGNIVIAGVGATTIMRILKGLKTKGQLQASRILVSAHKDEADLLSSEFLSQVLSDYDKIKEATLIERGRSRPLIIFDRK